MEVFGGGRAQRGRSSGNGPVGPPKVLNLVFYAVSDGEKLLAPDVPLGYSFGRARDIRPKTFFL